MVSQIVTVFGKTSDLPALHPYFLIRITSAGENIDLDIRDLPELDSLVVDTASGNIYNVEIVNADRGWVRISDNRTISAPVPAIFEGSLVGEPEYDWRGNLLNNPSIADRRVLKYSKLAFLRTNGCYLHTSEVESFEAYNGVNVKLDHVRDMALARARRTVSFLESEKER